MTVYLKLNDVCESIIDCPHESPEWLNEGVRVIRNFNLIDGQLDFSDAYYVDEETYKKRTRRTVPKAGDIIFSREAPIGNCAIVPENMKCCLGQRLVLLRVNHNVCSSEYLLTVLMSDYVKQQINQVSKRGSIVSNFAIEDLKELIIPIVDKKEEIAKIAELFRRKTKNNNQVNDNLQEQIKLLYDYWFTQFDYPDSKGNPYKTSGGKMVLNTKLKRLIPEGWNVVNLLEYVKWESNSQPPKSEFIYQMREGYVRFIQNRDYDSNSYKTFIPFKKSLSTVTKYDILMDKYGDAGRVRYGIEGVFNVALGKICVNNPIAQEYVRSFFESSSIYTYLHNSCMASTRASLSEANLATLDILVPPDELLSSYQKNVRAIRQLILKNKEENEFLASYRDWLLPMLMNGQVTITD